MLRQLRLDSPRFAFRTHEEFSADVPFRRGVGGVPVLEGVSSHFQCRRTEVFDVGDHVVVLGEVIDFAASDRPGLVYRGGQYAVADAHPSAVAQSREHLNKGFLDTTVRPALESITRRFESFFDAEFGEVGLNSKGSQIIGLLLACGALGPDELASSWSDRLRSYKAKALGSISPAEAASLQRTLTRLSEWVKAASAGSAQP